MIKGIIFDIDGVILDSMGIWNDLGARYIVDQGKEPEDNLGDILFSMSMEEGEEYLKSTYKLDESVEDILEGLRYMLQRFYYMEVSAKSGAEDILKIFKKSGIKITAATSSPRMHIVKALKRNGLFEYFDEIFTTSEIGVSKHNPDIYNKAAEFMGLDSQEVVVFEDSLYALITAKKAGYKTVGVYDKDGEINQEELKEKADLYIRELNELVSNRDFYNEFLN